MNVAPVVTWNKPDTVPVVELGTEELCWIVVEIKNSPIEQKQFTLLAHYQNRPRRTDEEGEVIEFDWSIYNRDSEVIDSVGWVENKVHCDFADYYDAIDFNDDFVLLGWAEFASPAFNGITHKEPNGFEYKTTSWGEVKVNVYAGENFDQHERYVSICTEGDQEPFEGKEAEFSSKRWPAGTKITVEVPECPNPDCYLDAEFQNDQGKCECGFDWKNWADEQYS